MTGTAPPRVTTAELAVPPPALLGWRRRPRVARRLDDLLDPACRLALVSAPPGYGKSVAVAGWAADRGIPCAWVTLDESDRDAARLSRDLLAALDGVRPGSGSLARLITPDTSGDARALADLVLDAVAADDSELLVVLDDFHAADGDATAPLVRILVERMPPFAHLVLVTREDPGLPLGRLRAHGGLVEVRGEDLRFTPDEAAAFVSDGSIDPAPELVRRLLDRTEGWAAALRLAVIRIGSSSDPSTAVEAMSGSHRHLIDYLGDEVMAGLDPALRETLVSLSVTERFSVDLCGVLSGRPDARALLDRAERDNLFVVPLDPDRRWFRLHGLFADYLRGRLEPAERAALHRAAAGWFEAAGLGLEAVAHALAAGDVPAAARLVGAEGRGLLEAGELKALAGWLAALPPAVVASDPGLAGLDAWGRFYTGDLAGAAALAERATAGVTAPTAAHGRLLILRALLATATRSDAEPLARAGLALVGRDELYRSLGLQAAGLAQLARGAVGEALGTLRAAFAAADDAGLPMAVLPAVNPLGHALQATGHRDEAEAVARRVLDAYRGPSDAPLPIAWSARLVLGIALFEGGDVAAARRELEGGLAAAQALGIARPILGWALPAIALARQASGDPDGALAILATDPRPGMAFPSLAGETEARIRLAQGDVAGAARWADAARAEAPEGSPLLAILGASAATTVARTRLAEGRIAEARAAIDPAVDAFATLGLVPDGISSLLVAASVAHAERDRERALADVRTAIGLAAPGGYVRRFVDDGTRLLPLLRGLTGTAPAFVARVTAAIVEGAGHGGSRRGGTVSAGPDGVLVESLTARELEVLRGMAAGASNARIAEELGVSAGTAKWHVAHVLAKLGARSRTEAVVRAQRLGLV